MSALVDCPGCQWGDHEKHDPAWGLIPGLIGGMACGCQGDCGARAAAATEAFIAKWCPPPTEPQPAEEATG